MAQKKLTKEDLSITYKEMDDIIGIEIEEGEVDPLEVLKVDDPKEIKLPRGTKLVDLEKKMYHYIGKEKEFKHSFEHNETVKKLQAKIADMQKDLVFSQPHRRISSPIKPPSGRVRISNARYTGSFFPCKLAVGSSQNSETLRASKATSP